MRLRNILPVSMLLLSMQAMADTPFDLNYQSTGKNGERPSLIFNDGIDTYVQPYSGQRIDLQDGQKGEMRGPYLVIAGKPDRFMINVNGTPVVVTKVTSTSNKGTMVASLKSNTTCKPVTSDLVKVGLSGVPDDQDVIDPAISSIQHVTSANVEVHAVGKVSLKKATASIQTLLAEHGLYSGTVSINEVKESGPAYAFVKFVGDECSKKTVLEDSTHPDAKPVVSRNQLPLPDMTIAGPRKTSGTLTLSEGDTVSDAISKFVEDAGYDVDWRASGDYVLDKKIVLNGKDPIAMVKKFLATVGFDAALNDSRLVVLDKQVVGEKK